MPKSPKRQSTGGPKPNKLRACTLKDVCMVGRLQMAKHWQAQLAKYWWACFSSKDLRFKRLESRLIETGLLQAQNCKVLAGSKFQNSGWTRASQSLETMMGDQGNTHSSIRARCPRFSNLEPKIRNQALGPRHGMRTRSWNLGLGLALDPGA